VASPLLLRSALRLAISLARALLMTGFGGTRIGGGGGGGGGGDGTATERLWRTTLGALDSASLRTILQTFMNFFASLA